MADDLTEARRRILTGAATARGLVDRALAIAGTPPAAAAFVAASAAAAGAAADSADAAIAAGRDPGALAGLAVSVKDLFDVAGEVTAAGSTILRETPAAVADAPAVARLRAAGAAFVGRTHMTEFAFSGVGLNPHLPLLANPATLALDPVPRIPGGSTSGGAASVATGAAWVALGSDTGGSIRIPAALQGVVGFKSTARLVPTAGAVPLSTTLDTVAAMTRSVRDAVIVHEVLAARTVRLERRPLDSWRFAVPSTLVLDGLEPAVARAFERSVAALSAAGAGIATIALAPLADVASINAGGGFSPAEAWAFHRRWLVGREADYDPRVAQRIRRGEKMSAADYIELLAARRDWTLRMERALEGIDALLTPTVPMVAPPIAPLLTDDAAFFATNALLLRNPSIVNLLDGCALSLPCHAAGELPVSLMVWSTAGHDDNVLDAGLAIESALAGSATPPPRG
jgi:amidase/aspartyl-tRNA(Asn)/glutamyl-tRNA(Gln) amidotransferase subunit A